MSVLVQRPHQVPGLITLPRHSHHSQPKISSPRRQHNLPTPSPAPVASPRQNKTVGKNQRAAADKEKAAVAAKPAPVQLSTSTTNSARSSKRRANNVVTANANAPVVNSSSKPVNPSTSTSNSNSTSVLALSSIPASVPASSTTVKSDSAAAASHDLSASSTTSLSRSVFPSSTSAPTTPLMANSTKVVKQVAPVTPSRSAKHHHAQNNSHRRPRTPPEFPFDDEQLVLNNVPALLPSAPTSPCPTPTPGSKRNRRQNAPGALPNVSVSAAAKAAQNKTWQQPIPLFAPIIPASASSPATPALGVAQAQASATFDHLHLNSASSPSLFRPATASPNVNVAQFLTRRPSHQRAPSQPNLPMYREHDGTFFLANPRAGRDVFAAASPDLPATPAHHARGASVSTSTSLPLGGLHARMLFASGGAFGGSASDSGLVGGRKRTVTADGTVTPSSGDKKGRGFAGASFQHAPDALAFPMVGLAIPGAQDRSVSSLSFNSSTSSSVSESEDDDVVDLGEEDDDFLM